MDSPLAYVGRTRKKTPYSTLFHVPPCVAIYIYLFRHAILRSLSLVPVIVLPITLLPLLTTLSATQTLFGPSRPITIGASLIRIGVRTPVVITLQYLHLIPLRILPLPTTPLTTILHPLLETLPPLTPLHAVLTVYELRLALIERLVLNPSVSTLRTLSLYFILRTPAALAAHPSTRWT